MYIVQNHIVSISEMKNSHQVIDEELLNKNQVPHWEVVALVYAILVNGQSIGSFVI